MRHDQQAMIEISIFCGSRKLIPDMMVMKNTKVLKHKIAIIHHLPLPERHQGHWAVPLKAVTAGVCITKAMYRQLAAL